MIPIGFSYKTPNLEMEKFILAAIFFISLTNANAQVPVRVGADHVFSSSISNISVMSGYMFSYRVGAIAKAEYGWGRDMQCGSVQAGILFDHNPYGLFSLYAIPAVGVRTHKSWAEFSMPAEVGGTPVSLTNTGASFMMSGEVGVTVRLYRYIRLGVGVKAATYQGRLSQKKYHEEFTGGTVSGVVILGDNGWNYDLALNVSLIINIPC